MKPRPTPEQIRAACRAYCERVPDYAKLPHDKQAAILQALLEIAGA